jgi:hypothetical protein
MINAASAGAASIIQVTMSRGLITDQIHAALNISNWMMLLLSIFLFIYSPGK